MRKRTHKQTKQSLYSLWDLVRFFLKLGSLGFGGPIALIGYMQQHLIEQKKWFNKQDYLEGLTLAQLCPGPLSTQLAIYFGWLKGRILGASLIAIAFILPSFLIVTALAAAYKHFGNLSHIQGILHGIGASVIAIIFRSTISLIKLVMTRSLIMWGIFCISILFSLLASSKLIWVFILSGLITMLINCYPKLKNNATIVGFTPFFTWHTISLLTAFSNSLLLKISIYFFCAGAFVFGSGLAIVPFLHSGVVEQYHWLTEKQFIDAVAVAMITPGPLLIIVAFIGYFVSGLPGGIIATISIFAPCYLLVIILTPRYKQIINNQFIKPFIKGVTTATVGALAGSTLILSTHAVFDTKSLSILLATLIILFTTKKIPDLIIIVTAGLIGFYFDI